MPIMSCSIGDKSGFKYGESGKCYTYQKGDTQGMKNAKHKAIIQGVAIGGGKLEKSVVELPEYTSKRYTKEEAEQWLTEYDFIANIFEETNWSYMFYQVPKDNLMLFSNILSTGKDGIYVRYIEQNNNIDILCVEFDKVSDVFETIVKSEDNHLLFGWAYVAQKINGEQVYDHSGEHVRKEDFQDLEMATYIFNIAYRQSDIRHDCVAKGYLIDSMVFTKEKIEAMKKSGHLVGDIAQGVWMGFWFPEDDDWKIIKDMKAPMFSLYGSAVKEIIEEV